MVFAILLIGPTSLFTNALPADGEITEPIKAEYAAYLDLDCPSNPNVGTYKSDFITPDNCVPLVKPTDPDNLNPPVFSGYRSGLAAQQTLDTTKYACRLSYYAGTDCSGFSVGRTEILGPPVGFGPCVNFRYFLDILGLFRAKANSVKMTCEPK